ncbi:GIY-YIG nuclease family protein [Candidatus Microgenomates bacterium]|nr:GIY-YIG nuclease family protein [Candidatus Microgenomates bacterium]
MKRYFVYIITNYENNVFYTGITNNLERRIWKHQNGFIKNSFCVRYRLYKLIWFEEFSHPSEAINAEKKVKDMRRERKINIIKAFNPKFKDLSALR